MSSNIKEDPCEEDFVDCVEGVDTESAGRQQKKDINTLILLQPSISRSSGA